MHNSSTNTRPLKLADAPANKQHAWAATPDSCPAGSCAALAVFNAADKAQKVVVNLTSLRLEVSNDQPADSGDDSAPTKLCGRDLWTRRALVPTSAVDVFAPKVRCAPAPRLLPYAFLSCWPSASLALSLRRRFRSRRTALGCMCSGARMSARQATRCSRRRQAANQPAGHSRQKGRERRPTADTCSLNFAFPNRVLVTGCVVLAPRPLVP